MCNANAAMPEGAGFYYNEGVPAAPEWVRLSATTGSGQALTFPFDTVVNTGGNAFEVLNSNSAATSSAIAGKSHNGIGTQGRTVTGRGVQAVSTGTGTGLYAYSASGKALDVNGNVKIAGGGLQLQDVKGNVLQSKAIQFTPGMNAIEQNVGNLPAGQYIIRIPGKSVPFIKL